MSFKKNLLAACALAMQMVQADLTVSCKRSNIDTYVSYETYQQAGAVLDCSVFQLMCIEQGAELKLKSYSYKDAVSCQDSTTLSAQFKNSADLTA